MKKYLFILLILLSASAIAQAPNIIYGKKVIISTRDTSSAEFQIINSTRNVGGFLKNTGLGNTIFKVPTVAEILGLPDSLSARWTKTQSDERYLQGSTYQPTFINNVTVNAGPLARVGKYGPGQTIPAAGKTLDEFLSDIATAEQPVIYTAPTAGIGSNVGSGYYEIGTNLGSIVLSSSYTQNDGGTATGSTYSKYVTSWNNLSSNTDNISSLTSTTYYRVTTTYNQGACKTNNLSQVDCNGRINAGSAVSGNIELTPFFKRYFGFLNNLYPTAAEILALSQDNNGTTASLSLSNVTPSGAQHFVYFTKGTVTSIVINGIPATDAFTITNFSLTNARGHTSAYSWIYSNQPQTQTINSIIFN